MEKKKFNKNDWFCFMIEFILALILFPILWVTCDKLKVSLYVQSLTEELEYYEQLLDEETLSND
jgi:hypothetical protein